MQQTQINLDRLSDPNKGRCLRLIHSDSLCYLSIVDTAPELRPLYLDAQATTPMVSKQAMSRDLE